MRFLGLLKADKESEAGARPSPELMERMGKVYGNDHQGWRPGGERGTPAELQGARVRVSDGQVTVIDGPFTESKELVASYALLEANSLAEAIEWTTRFLKVLGKGECEVRPIFSASDFAPEHLTAGEAAGHCDGESARRAAGRRADGGVDIPVQVELWTRNQAETGRCDS